MYLSCCDVRGFTKRMPLEENGIQLTLLQKI